ncbi:MAG: HAD-IA family hydrolase, partial [Planctomycetes bacterium]|nr:HAD-IA family hydrolase [Planctomycetota bacterium]
PRVFSLAAERLEVPPLRSIVVEDAAAGVEAAIVAGMRVIGVGPRERVGRADHVVAAVAEITVGDFVRLSKHS